MPVDTDSGARTREKLALRRHPKYGSAELKLRLLYSTRTQKKSHFAKALNVQYKTRTLVSGEQSHKHEVVRSSLCAALRCIHGGGRVGLLSDGGADLC